jgi:Cu+-exporting ATPase
MKTRLIILLAAIAVLGVTAAEPSVKPNATNQFSITGMHCDGCAKGLASELKRTPGVATASVTFSNQLAVVAFDTNRVSTVELVKAVEEAGFKAQLQKP